MLVPFHPSITHALTAIPAVSPTKCQSPNVSLSGVLHCINIKHRQNSVVSETTRQSKCVWRVGCKAADAVARQWAACWEESHLVNKECHRSIKFYSTELGLWQGTVSFLTASVCTGVMHSHERESHTECAAPSLTRFRLSDDSRENIWSIGALQQTTKCVNVVIFDIRCKGLFHTWDWRFLPT